MDPAALDAPPTDAAGIVADPGASWDLAPHWGGSCGQVLGPDRLPAAPVQHGCDRGHPVRFGTRSVVHAGGLRLRARFRLPRTWPALHPVDQPPSFCRLSGGHASSRDLRTDLWCEARLGGHLAAAARAGILRQCLRRLPNCAGVLFKTIPTEMDEAAAIDGAGRSRRSLGCWSTGPAGGHCGRDLPHRYSGTALCWRASLIYQYDESPEMQTLAIGLQRLQRGPPPVGSRPTIQAGTLMTLVIPVVAFLLTQRFFTRGIVVTGVDK